jgi:prolyl-tRNA synthetase
LAQNKVVLVRRDTGKKISVSQEGIDAALTDLFARIQQDMLAKSKAFRDEHTYAADSFEKFRETLKEKPGFVWAHWCGSPNCEKEIKAVTQADIRTVPQDGVEEGRCVLCGERSPQRVLFAKAY